MEDKNLPLVSVPVITYNSSKTVIETLDSIYNQTYPNIELIVSDDCSTDNTVEICRDWIESHKKRFVRTELLTVEKNTGVSANCNRGRAACNGEWIKGIAGDDLLLPDCIQSCIDYVEKYPDTIYLFGKMVPFGGTNESRERVNRHFNYKFFQLSQDQRYHSLIYDGNHIPAPTAFYNKKKVNEIGIKNDERIPLIEDWPKWLNLVDKGIYFHFIDKYIVKYRLSDSALSTTKKPSQKYLESLLRIFLYYQFPYMWKYDEDKISLLIQYARSQKLLGNRYLWTLVLRLLKLIKK